MRVAVLVDLSPQRVALIVAETGIADERQAVEKFVRVAVEDFIAPRR